MTWGDIGNKGSSRVYYFSGRVTELQRTEFPSDLKDEVKLPEMPMTFSVKFELPYVFIFFYHTFSYALLKRRKKHVKITI